MFVNLRIDPEIGAHNLVRDWVPQAMGIVNLPRLPPLTAEAAATFFLNEFTRGYVGHGRAGGQGSGGDPGPVIVTYEITKRYW